MIGRWTVLNDLRERRYADGRREFNGSEVPLWERWEVRDTSAGLEAQQVAVADAREGPWREAPLGPFPLAWGGVRGAFPGAFVLTNADASLTITGISDGKVLHGKAVTLRSDHAKVEEFMGVCDA